MISGVRIVITFVFLGGDKKIDTSSPKEESHIL